MNMPVMHRRKRLLPLSLLLVVLGLFLATLLVPVAVASASPQPTRQVKLTASDAAKENTFGITLALSGDGNTMLAAAPERNSNTGAAYVFTRTGTAWSQQAELFASDSTLGDYFGGDSTGVALSYDGNIAVIGAYRKNSSQGATYVFIRSGSSWHEQAEFLSPNGAPNDEFGFSVALSRNATTLLVGARGQQSANGASEGAAYVFTRSGTTWSAPTKLSSTRINSELVI